MLGALHEAEEIGKVHDPGEIGVDELDDPAVAEVKLGGNVHQEEEQRTGNGGKTRLT